MDIDYKPEGSDPDIKAVDEEEENSDTEYAVTSTWDIASEDHETQCHGKSQAGTLGAM